MEMSLYGNRLVIQTVPEFGSWAIRLMAVYEAMTLPETMSESVFKVLGRTKNV